MTTYTKRKLSSARFLLVLPLFAIFAIPGTAGQPGDMSPQQRLAAMQAELGVAVDPHAATVLSIHLPEHFTAETGDLALRFI